MPILETLAYIGHFYKENNDTADTESEQYDAELLEQLNNLDIYRKIADENFDFDKYKTIRDLIRVYCYENLKLSK